MNPDAIPETGLLHQGRNGASDRLGSLGMGGRANHQETDEQKAKKRSVRHLAQPISVLGLLLVIGTACSRAPSTNVDALVVMLPRDAEQLDPRFVADPYGLRVSRLLFASLVTIDPKTLEVRPDLAESVTVRSPTEIEVTLREGLRFSDGSPLTTEDVIATFDGVVDPALGSRYAHTYRRIAEMRLIGPRTIRFVLSEPHATFLTDLELPIVRSEDAHRRIASQEQPFPVGAGPYRLVKREPGLLELRANPYWHRGSPKHPNLRLVVIRDDNTRALRMLASQGDLAMGSIPPLLLPMFEDDPRFEIREAPGISTMYLGFETESPKLRDVRVRRAIAHAIDRDLLVRAKYDGLARTTESWIPKGHWAYANTLRPVDFDPGRARELLDAAGFVDPTGPEPRMSLVLRTTSDRFRQSIARAIAAMLREVGIEVDVRPSEAATLIADLNRGRFEITLLQVPEVIEPHVLSWFFDSSRIPGPQHEGANRWRYENPELDALFELGRTQVEVAKRRAAYVHIQQILARDLPVLPLWQPDTVAVLRRGLDVAVSRDGRFGTLAF
jgi:peptide/nickel transport system substrate-binding protein